MDEELEITDDEVTQEIEYKEILAKKEELNAKKKKVRLKNKGILFIGILVVLLLVLGLGGFFGYKAYEKNTMKKIKSVYTDYVITKKEAKLYNKKHKVIGSIQKDFPLTLKHIKIKSLKNKYLQIGNSDYYISYKDIKAYNPKMEAEEETYYLPLEKRIETKKEITLYEEDKKVATLKGIKDGLVEKMDKDYYYIHFLGKTLKVKKEKEIKLVDATVDLKEKKADHVSVIYYDKILPDCGADDTCLYPSSVKAHIKRLRKDNYYFITKDDFIAYMNGNINIKENAVLLAVGTENDTTNALKEELKIDIAKFDEKDEIKLVVTNKAATPQDDKASVNCYQSKRYTIIDNYSRMAAGEEVPDNGKETSNNQGIAVINYHFFYDQTIPGESDACHESICLEREKLKSHFEWLNNNGYKTLTIEEYADWMDGVIEIPDKSVLLTIDDGAHGTGLHNGNVLIPLMEEYKIHATLFLITGWWGLENYQSPYLDVQSHTNNLHYEAQCADGRGKVACSDYNTVYNDIKTSIDVLQDNTSFCFPFYSADREGIQAVKDLGFRVAFVGGSTKSRRSNNHYLIPRYPVLDDITLNEFISMVS